FATIETPLGPTAVVVEGRQYIDLQSVNPIIPRSLRQILAAGPLALRAVQEATRFSAAKRNDLADVKLLPPIPDPKKIVCLGLNYADHAKEGGVPIPKEPVLFSKYPTALIGHDDAIVLPPVSKEVDYEAELVIVVGKRGRHIGADQAMDYVAGYTIGHDVSARDWQLKKDGKQWMSAKPLTRLHPPALSW